MSRYYRVTRIDGTQQYYTHNQDLYFPVGGGFGVRLNMDSVSKIEAVNELPSFPLEKAQFCFDDGPNFHGYYNKHQRWNGWACPHMTREQLEVWLPWFCEPGNGYHYKFMDDDTLYVWFGKDAEDEYNEAVPFEVDTVDGKLTLWDVGMGYTWGVVDKEELLHQEARDLMIALSEKYVIDDVMSLDEFRVEYAEKFTNAEKHRMDSLLRRFDEL